MLAWRVLELSGCSFTLGICVFNDVHERLHREVQITCFFGALSTDLEVENIAPDSEGSLGAHIELHRSQFIGVPHLSTGFRARCRLAIRGIQHLYRSMV
jgi:hypothetical protein